MASSTVRDISPEPMVSFQASRTINEAMDLFADRHFVLPAHSTMTVTTSATVGLSSGQVGLVIPPPCQETAPFVPAGLRVVRPETSILNSMHE